MLRAAIDIAKKIISLSNPEIGDIMSNLKLQKLLYYAQGFHLAMYDAPIFAEDIRAWQYGPVVPEVYSEFKKFGSGSIDVLSLVGAVELDERENSLIIDVWNVYGQYSAFRLMEFTHEEPPWKSTPLNQVISHDKLREYFITQIVE
jgi:uncharacterized phage-associated protein